MGCTYPLSAAVVPRSNSRTSRNISLSKVTNRSPRSPNSHNFTDQRGVRELSCYTIIDHIV
jgi:hypothetical protein